MSTDFDYRFGHDVYRISVTVVIDISQGRKQYRPEIVIEKNVSDLDAEETRRVQVEQLFSSVEKAQRYALGHAKKLIEEGRVDLPVSSASAIQPPSDL
ncbi:MAG: hypothetical protein ACM3ZT_11335 [Bacillota bacterium]